MEKLRSKICALAEWVVLVLTHLANNNKIEKQNRISAWCQKAESQSESLRTQNSIRLNPLKVKPDYGPTCSIVAEPLLLRAHTERRYLTGQSGRPPRHGIMSQMVDQVCDNRSGCDGNQTLLDPGPHCRDKQGGRTRGHIYSLNDKFTFFFLN